MRVKLLSVVAMGLLASACGNTDQARAVTGGLGGAAVGGLIGGPVGALVGLGLGGVGGVMLDEGADRKISRLGDSFVNRPLAEATTSDTAASGSMERSGAADAGRERPLDAEQVHDMLHDSGYERVYNIRRDGNAYRARGEVGGRAYDIVVEASTGRVISSDPVVASRSRREPASGAAPRQVGELGPEQVRQKLRREGYTQVNSVQRQGDIWVAQADWNRMAYTVQIDGRTGRIISSTESGASMSGSSGGRPMGPQPGPQMAPPPVVPPTAPSGAPQGTTGQGGG
jgi:hypothetical protein